MSTQGEVFTGGASTSQHVDAKDDDHFQNTTFKLKRTRSLGLLDEFIDSDAQEKQVEKKNEQKRLEKLEASSASNDFDSKNVLIDLGSQSSQVLDSSGSTGSSEVAVSLPLDANSPFLKSPDIVPHDDTNLAPEPSRHVDYLSHQWDVTDISKSWRYIILRRKNFANAARLENASWRTWAQRRSNLKTISPEEVNWSKDSDVTWLYGPIVDDDDHEHEHEHDQENNDLLGTRSFNTASSVVAGDISIARKAHRPKPILKKRTMQDMMISHLNLLNLEMATVRAEQEHRRREDAAAQARKEAAQLTEKPPDYFDYDVISAKLNSQYKNYSQSNSRACSANNSSLDFAQKHSLAVSAEAVAATLLMDPKSLALSHLSVRGNQFGQLEEQQTISEARHVRFNEEVQQCIAIDDSFDSDDSDDSEDATDYDYSGIESFYDGSGRARDHYDGDSENEENEDDDDDNDEGGFFLNVRSFSKSMPESSLPGLSSAKKTPEPLHDEQDDDKIVSVLSIRTIHMLPPITLNYGSSNEESDDYTLSISHNIVNNSSRGYDYYYDYNSVYEVNPNHAIYGNRARAPDVVDVPENISLGSNFDYEIIENEDVTNYGTAIPEVYSFEPSRDDLESGRSEKLERQERIPISSLDNSVSQSKSGSNVFNCSNFHSDSESGSENEGGLSTSAHNSSQSLAQQDVQEPQPKHISSINPRYSSTSLSKQPHSSGSLVDQFFGTIMTLAKSNSELSDMFLKNKSSDGDTNGKNSNEELSNLSNQSFTTVAKKTSPLPSKTTAANIILGSRTPKPKPQQQKSLFLFDSDSDSEPEYVENAPLNNGMTANKNESSFASLYKVAGRTSISRSTSDMDDAKKGQAVPTFLGSWNKSGGN
ncbi:hypothetical protein METBISCDRAFT_21213 [Metschnikowia bicuspidata]|uniref:Nitrogen regulatory protein areA GATA-like domain-containing protein n=1 Tax=Metschnikowia bicuspidata TaxID=27322 RepID=A0A4P9ZK63_9ASCO|nr:hypothetical protein METBISCDRAFT_21213 [Metschnikowia bicuspidata]